MVGIARSRLSLSLCVHRIGTYICTVYVHICRHKCTYMLTDIRTHTHIQTARRAHCMHTACIMHAYMHACNCLHACTQTHRQTEGRRNGGTEGRTEGQTEGRTDRGRDGRTDVGAHGRTVTDVGTDGRIGRLDVGVY